jgi:hypothetical protein
MRRRAMRILRPQPEAGSPATRFLWVDVDHPGQLPALWALLAERPCHLLIESGGSGGAHAYWKLAPPLGAAGPEPATGEAAEPIEQAHLRLIHRLGVDEHGKPDVADLACRERSRVTRLAGTVNYKTGQYARIVEADSGCRRTGSRSWSATCPTRSRWRPRRERPGRPAARTRTSGSRRPSTSRAWPG